MSSTLPDQSPAASPPEPLEPQAASPAEAMPDPPLEAAADLAPAPVQPVRAMPWQSSGRNIWTISSSAWPVLVLSGLVVLLLTLTWLLPQLPGQLDSEAGAAERWLATAAATAGAMGGVLRSLGLFQIMQSTLLQILLGLLIFVLLMQLARLTHAAWTLRQAPRVLDQSGGVNGEPLPIAAASTLLRWRSAHPASPLALTNELHRLLDARLRHVERRTVRVAATHVAASLPTVGIPAASEGGDSPTLEDRLLAVCGTNAAMLRPLLVLGMLAATLLVWISATFGWVYTADHLAPGERMVDAVHDLNFEYRIDESAPGILQPQLIVGVAGETATMPVEQTMQQDVGNAVVRAQPGAPGLLVQTVNGQLLLARPGQVTPVSAIGFGFPSAGSEETLLLPQQAAGLRLVRTEQGAPGPAEDGFLVEVFQSGSEQAVLRTLITAAEIVTIPTATGEVVLAVTPLPNLSIQVQRSPLPWLLWVALALCGAGLLGFRQQPGFVLAQIGPWPLERAVVTVQSDLPGEMDSIRRWYSESTQGGVQE